MAQQRQGLSRTLPKSFTFSSIESSFPRTPEHPRAEPQIPPPPRHSSYRVRRPRFDSHAGIFSSLTAEPNIFDLSRPDVPLPSIEFPISDTTSEPDFSAIQPVSSEFLQVPARRMEFKTPPAQIRTTPFNFPRATPDAADEVDADPIERPSSRASDSSVSSIETYTTQPSLGGSCTSPESEIYDPFSFQPADTRKHLLETPSTRDTNRGQSLDLPKRKSRWTADMDNHLWNTYQMYLQDPTTTPFKTLPGSLPPLGVSHRVAREAKKTWTRSKSKRDNEISTITTSDPALPTEERSGSSTPTAKKSTNTKPRWPRSEAATRRRLKFLCKRKLSIAPHYQRLLQSRSPSPFLDDASTPARRPVGPKFDHSSAAFMTRDLGVSLVSSSLPATFANFGAVEPPVESPAEEPSLISNFNSPSQQPSQQDLGIPISTIPSHVSALQDPFPRLGSPFMYNTWGPETSRREARGAAARGARRDTIHVAGSRLRTPPPRMDVPSNVHKRRAHHRLESSPNALDIQRNVRDLARDGKLKDGQRRVRLRNRGNTTSGGFSSKERIEQLFSPTSPFTFPDNQASSPQESEQFLRPRAETIRRLGSPFKLDPGPRFQHPRSPRHAPSLSDPFMNSSIKSQVHLEHQNEPLAAASQVPTGRLPYDPTEAGISDAERIRRQILNLPFTKNSM